MKRLSVLIVLLQSVFTVSAFACPSGFYSLACRGKIALDSEPIGDPQGAYVYIRFKRTTFGVGGNYGKLPAGSCAWLDRGVSATEPAVVTWAVGTTQGTSISGTPMLTQCAGDASCVFQGCAMNYPASGFLQFNGDLQTIYP